MERLTLGSEDALRLCGLLLRDRTGGNGSSNRSSLFLVPITMSPEATNLS